MTSYIVIKVFRDVTFEPRVVTEYVRNYERVKLQMEAEIGCICKLLA